MLLTMKRETKPRPQAVKRRKPESGGRAGSASLSGLLKSLVERSVDDPAERRLVYAELLKRFKAVMERRDRKNEALKRPLSVICAALELLTEEAVDRLSPHDRYCIDISLKNARRLNRELSS